MQKVNNSGIFASPLVKKKVYITLSFLSLLTIYLAITVTILPAGAITTDSFIFNYFVSSTIFVFAYSFFFNRKHLIVLPVIIYVIVTSILFLLGNYLMNYGKDYEGANPRTIIAILLACTLVASVVRLIQLNSLSKE